MGKGIPLNVLWDALDEKYKFIARDRGNELEQDIWYAYTHRPTIGNEGCWVAQDIGDFLEITLPIDAMHGVPWDQTLIERPVPIQVGAFGKFWDGNEEPKDEDTIWGYLNDIDMEDHPDYPYKLYGNHWTHFVSKMPVPLMKIGEKKE